MARADAARNREALLASARTLFAQHGLEVPLEHVARAAGVGIATLYRHFPTRASLVMTACSAELDALCDSPTRLLADLPPDEALRAFAHQVLGEAPLFIASVESDPERVLLDRVERSLQVLLDANVAAGLLAPAQGREILMVLAGLMLALPKEQDRHRAHDLFDLVLDGLRHRAR